MLLGGCTNVAPPPPPMPPTDGAFDYQLGGAYEPADGVDVVARDRTAEAPDGVYGICYVNGFQTQPGELGLWPNSVLLRDGAGSLVVDPAWPDEVLLDTRTEAKREAIAEIVHTWIDGCADSGYDAVEFDNLDTFARSNDPLTLDAAVTLASMFVDHAHARGLAAAQKNAAEVAARMHSEAGFDFAVAEECAQFAECNAYIAVYGNSVFNVEYLDAQEVPFDFACDADIRMILRDRNLTSPDDPAYVYEAC